MRLTTIAVPAQHSTSELEFATRLGGRLALMDGDTPAAVDFGAALFIRKLTRRLGAV
jgi:hypothetical protein